MSVEISPRKANKEDFFTYQNRDAYLPDWAGFYDKAGVLRASFLEEYPHWEHLIYGDTPYHLVNVFAPCTGDLDQDKPPFILYFHGGRWREGHPDFYDCLGKPWLDRGAVFASFGYRLEPDWEISDAVDDCICAVKWAHREASRFGADPNNLILVGHSAGAHIIEMATLTDWADERGLGTEWRGAVTGVIGMSGPAVLGDLIPDHAESEALSPALRVTRSPEHVILSHGDPEPNKKGEPAGMLTKSSRRLGHVLEEFGASPTVVELGDVDHLESGTCFGDPQGPLFSAASKVVFAKGNSDVHAR